MCITQAIAFFPMLLTLLCTSMLSNTHRSVADSYQHFKPYIEIGNNPSLLALNARPATLVERHGLLAPDYQSHSRNMAHVNDINIQLQGLYEAHINHTYIQRRGLNEAHINYTYVQMQGLNKVPAHFSNIVDIKSVIPSKALPLLPSICWMVLNALFEYVCLTTPYILHNCILAYLCLNDAPFQLCVALWCRFQRHCMLKHEYSNLIKTLLRLGCSYKLVSCFFIFSFSLQFLLFHMSVQSVNVFMMMGYESCSSISIWYGYELPLSNRVLGSLEVNTHHLHSITHWYGCYCHEPMITMRPQQTAGGKKLISFEILKRYITLEMPSSSMELEGTVKYKFVDQLVLQAARAELCKKPELLICHAPLEVLKDSITIGQAKAIAKKHHISVFARAPVAEVMELLSQHMCTSRCSHYYTLFSPENPALTTTERKARWYKGLGKSDRKKVNKVGFSKCKSKSTFKNKRFIENKNSYFKSKIAVFPPKPPSDKLIHKIITGFCKDTHPSNLIEAGCAACGQLMRVADYESSEVRRASFIIPEIEDSFSALTQNFDFFPRNLMARLFTQNGNYQ
jgi:hypothetical protein